MTCAYANLSDDNHGPATETRNDSPICQRCARDYDQWLAEEERAAAGEAHAEVYGPETTFDADW